QAWHFGLLAQPPGDDLIEADAGMNFPAAGEVRAGEKIAGLATVDAADEDLAQFHLLAFALGPPLFAVKAVARKKAGEAHRRLGSAGGAAGFLIAPDADGFKPGKRHGDAEAVEEGPAGKRVEGHIAGAPVARAARPCVLRMTWASRPCHFP